MHFRRSRLAIIFLVSALFPIANIATGQDSVRVTVSVVGNNVPVTNLAKGDFSVQDSGKPRTVDGFEGPSSYAAKPPQLGPNEFSNAPDVSQSGAIFVVLDTIDTRYIDERDLREMILKFLGKASQSKHAVTLAIMDNNGVKVYHDYRTGPDVLQAALIKAGLGGMKGATPPAGVNEADVSAEAARLTAFAKGDLSNATAVTQLLRATIETPLYMLQDVAESGWGLPGRKALVWITNAIPFDINPKTYQFESRKEQSNGVAVNGAQAGGMKAQLSADQMKRVVPIWRRSVHDLFYAGFAVYPVEAVGSQSAGQSTFTIENMKILAQMTGGKSYIGNNDPFPDILEVSNGNTAGYVLTYNSDNSTGADFRPIDVTTKNSSLIVSHPAGYFPLDLAKVKGSEDVSAGVKSPLEFTGLIFKVGVGAIEEGSGNKKKVNLVITLGGDTGVLNEATRKVDVGLYAVAKNAKGEQVGKLYEGAGGQFPPEAVAQIKELGFQLKREIEVPPGDCDVHFVIRDNQTGRIGSLIFPLKVQ
jgi:VWFA-related protein